MLSIANTLSLSLSLQTSIDQLLMHFTSTIHNKAFSIVSGFVQLCSNDDNYLKYPYSDLPQVCVSVCVCAFILSVSI